MTDVDRTEGDARAHERSLSLLYAALESTADGLLIVDRRGRVVRYNNTFLRLWRVPESLAESRDDARLLEFVLDQLRDPQAFLARVREIYDTPEAVSFDFLHFKDGRVFERYSQPQRLDDEIVGRVWSFRDVSERHQAEAALRRSEAWLRQVIDQVPHFIFAKDRDGRFVLANRALAEAYGTTVDDMIGKTDADFLASDDEVRHFRAQDLAALEGTVSEAREHEHLTDAAGNLRTLDVLRMPAALPRSDQPGILGVATDVTARRQLETELLQSQRMDAIGRLAGGVAHDFNNLLTAILGFSSELLDELPADDRRREDLVDILTAAERAADLTRQLLAFSRRQVLRPRVVDLNELVSALQRLLRRVLGEDIELDVALEPGLLRVRADPGQLEQVIVNLAVNAREAMPRGGRLLIETRNLRASSIPEAMRGQGRVEAVAVLRVTDSGVGMGAEMADRIFEPFFTTKERGTGLGLSMAYGIVKQTGGHIEVQTAIDKGASFTVYLPATTEPVDVAAAPPARLPARGTDATILLAEDEEAVRRLIKRLLVADGYRVLEAGDGEEALTVAEGWDGPIDLLLTDLVMPRMNGRQLAEAISSRRPGIRLAFMSGYTADAYGRETSPLPGAPFLQKPFDGTGLRRTVRSALERDADPT